MLKKISIFWIILVALLLASLVPLGVIAFRAIESTSREVEREQRAQLIARVAAHADTVEQQLGQFQIATQLAATRAGELLLNGRGSALTPEEQADRMQKYQRDQRNVLGLDAWYYNSYYLAYGDNRVSNVFVNDSTLILPTLETQIVVTEDLNPIFDSILSSEIGTRWVYLTTAEGMIRIYPWQDNSGNSSDWDPRTYPFYTIATPDNNPQRLPVWTAPYNDYLGTGVMVTSSIPIYDGSTFIGVMSHDLLIEDLQNQILSFKVDKTGFAFLLDRQGNIIVHKDYQPTEELQLGEELTIRLTDKDSRMEPVVEAMQAQAEGVHDYTDADGNRWLVVFTTVPTTGWQMAMMQRYSEINEPATEITRQVLTGAVILIVLVVLVSIWLARRITHPVMELSRTARQIETSVDAETAEALSSTLQSLSNVSSAKEIANLASVFEQMVMTLHQRMTELNSIYAMGQTITAKVDFDQTVQAVLAAVKKVVAFDAAEVSVVYGNNLVVEAWAGNRETFNDTTGRKYQIGRGPTGMIAQTKAPVFMPVISPDEEDFKRTMGYATEAGEFLVKTTKVMINSFLGIPLLIGDRLVGTLTLVHHEAGHFTEDDKRQLNKLAAQASIAIDNAIQVRQRENALKAQIRELKVEIDQAKLTEQVDKITTTDYFQYLQANAAKMRERVYTGNRRRPLAPADPTPPDDPDDSGSSPDSAAKE